MKRSRFPFYITLGVIVFFYLPIVMLVIHSFNASRFGGRWMGFSLKWYSQLFYHPEIWQSLERTLVIGISATGVSVVLGTLAGLALHFYGHTSLQKVHYVFIYTPLVVPDILMGMSLLLFFVFLGIGLGLFTIFLAHVTFCISYVAFVILSRLQDFDNSLLEAARDLGASSWQATWRVLIPHLMPAIVAGGLLAFTLSIDDFVISFFVAGPGATTLPIRIYSMIKHGSPPLINALSTLMLFVTFILIGVTQKLIKEEKP